MKTGRVVALKVEHYSNAGNTLDLSQCVSRVRTCIWGSDWEVMDGPHSPIGTGLLTSCLGLLQ